MKTKVIVALAMSAGFITASMAAPTMVSVKPNDKSGVEYAWTSPNKASPVTITSAGVDATIVVKVDREIPNSSNPSTLVKLDGCGSTTSIQPGSAAICNIGPKSNGFSPTLTIVTDASNQYGAAGYYQVNP